MSQRGGQVLAPPFLLGFLPSSNVYRGRHCGFTSSVWVRWSKISQSIRQADKGTLPNKLWDCGAVVSLSGSVSFRRVVMDEISDSHP